MGSVMFSVVVLGVFLLVQILAGNRLGNAGKPYKAAGMAGHIILSLFIVAGLSVSVYKLHGITAGKLYSMLSLHVTGALLLINIITGIILTVVKKDNPALVLTHKVTSVLMAVSVIACIIFLAVKI